MLLKNASILYGNELTYVASTNLKISEKIFKLVDATDVNSFP